jgi:hypothetical protein
MFLKTFLELGTSFVVSNVGEFSRSILGSHFKHNNVSFFPPPSPQHVISAFDAMTFSRESLREECF